MLTLKEYENAVINNNRLEDRDETDLILKKAQEQKEYLTPPLREYEERYLASLKELSPSIASISNTLSNQETKDKTEGKILQLTLKKNKRAGYIDGIILLGIVLNLGLCLATVLLLIK